MASTISSPLDVTLHLKELFTNRWFVGKYFGLIAATNRHISGGETGFFASWRQFSLGGTKIQAIVNSRDRLIGDVRVNVEIVEQKVVRRSEILNPLKWRAYQSQIGNVTAFLQINTTFNDPVNDSGASC